MDGNFNYFNEAERARQLLASLRQVPVDCTRYALARFGKEHSSIELGCLCLPKCLFIREEASDVSSSEFSSPPTDTIVD